MIGSTVRVLELLEFDYAVSAPRNVRKKGNKSPRIINLDVGQERPLSIHNSHEGYTWASSPDGKAIAEIRSIEDLYAYLLAKYWS
jgi:hypothetical protein